jgi:uncharacterized protein
MHDKAGKMRRNLLSATGKFIDVFDLAPEDIELLHIAHALATKVRFNGSAKVPYSIAQHCCLAAKYANEGLSRQVALLHDAAEAYLYDIARPHKGEDEFVPYVTLEQKIKEAIYQKYIPDWAIISETVAANYHWIDRQLLINEGRVLLHNWANMPDLNAFSEVLIKIEPWPWQEAEETFLALAAVLGIKD